MTNGHYVATLKCNGKKVAEAIGKNKKLVAETICHYLSQYIDEAEDIDLKSKLRSSKTNEGV